MACNICPYSAIWCAPNPQKGNRVCSSQKLPPGSQPMLRACEPGREIQYENNLLTDSWGPMSCQDTKCWAQTLSTIFSNLYFINARCTATKGRVNSKIYIQPHTCSSSVFQTMCRRMVRRYWMSYFYFRRAPSVLLEKFKGIYRVQSQGVAFRSPAQLLGRVDLLDWTQQDMRSAVQVMIQGASKPSTPV